MTRNVVVFGCLGIVLGGCPPSARKSDKSEPASCVRFGQTCELSPGKLGTCVMRDGCNEPAAACFVCQSQH